MELFRLSLYSKQNGYERSKKNIQLCGMVECR